MSTTILYRGPMERARVEFLVQALLEPGTDFDFIWVSPVSLSDDVRERGVDFVRGLGASRVHFLQHRLREIFKTRKEVKRLIRTGSFVGAIGFSSTAVLPRGVAGRLVWCVNGIPEEEEMGTGRGGRLRSLTSWLATRSRRPDLVIVVSEPMARLVRRYHRRVPIHVAPTCADLNLFSDARQKLARRYFCYLGTGAPWQALDLLGELWQAIHRKDPEVYFRVISRDPRTHVLAEGIDAGRIEFVGANDRKQVAEWLGECEAGFLIRRPNIVNAVSFPTKLGEYTAAGLWVVSSDFDWDIARFMSTWEVGPLVPPEFDAESAAERVLAYRGWVRDGSVVLQLDEAATELGKDVWLERTRRVVSELWDGAS